MKTVQEPNSHSRAAMVRADDGSIPSRPKSPQGLSEVAQSLVEWFDSCPPELLTGGLDWYTIAAQEIRAIAADHGVNYRHLTFAAAAISPRLRWAQNLEAARELAQSGTTHFGFGANRRTAERCMSGDVDALHGRKVEAFAANLLGDQDRVTLDGWAIRAAIGKATCSPRQFAEITEAYREVARLRGVTPAQAQAIVWVSIRGGAL